MDLMRFLVDKGPAFCLTGSMFPEFEVHAGTAKTAAQNLPVVTVISNITEAVRDHQPL